MKKCISMIMSLTVLMTSLLPTFTANAAFSDVADTNPYKEAITTLSGFEVIKGYDDGTFGAEKEISRAEFTAIIVRMLGLDDLKTPITTFPDVAADHWANANIKTAFDLGIINGFDDGTFKPDAPVTYEQALKMVVCTLGYQPYAEALGGYPDGYRAQAIDLEITDKVVSLGYSQNAPRGAIAQVMFNALEVPKFENLGGSWVNSGKTLLKDYLNVHGSEGKLVGVGESTTSEGPTGLYPTQMAIIDIKTDELHVINFADYDVTASQLVAKLGTTMQVYYRKDKLSNDKWLVDINDEAQNNTEVTVNSTDITDLSGNTVKYRTGDGTKTATVRFAATDLSIRYNGQAVKADDTITFGTGDDAEEYSFPDALSVLFDPTSDYFMYGTIRFVSTDSSKTFTTVDIYNYDIYVSQTSVNSTDYRLVDKKTPSKTLFLDPDSNSYSFVLTKNGNEIAPTGITAGDVVLCATSLDGSYKTVNATSKTVSGKISSLNNSKGTVTIAGKEYKYSQYLIDYLAKETKELSLGQTIKAYTDEFGTLVWATVTTSETFYPYAYVIDAFESNDVYSMKLFAPTNTSVKSVTASTPYSVKTYKLADKVKLNGERVSPGELLSALADTENIPDEDTSNLSGYNQVIKVGFDSSSKIDNVITADGELSGKQNTDEGKLAKFIGGEHDVTTNAIKDNGRTLYSIKSSTPMFVIPSDRKDADGYAIKQIISSSSLKNGATDKMLEAYDVNTSQYPSIVVAYSITVQTGTPIMADTKYSLITDVITTGVDDTIGEYDALDTYDEASTAASKKIPSSVSADVSEGDIAQFGYDKDGFVNAVTVLLERSSILAELAGDCDWRDGFSGRTNLTTQSTTSSKNSRSYAMYNVVRVTEDGKLHATKYGFTAEDEEGNAILPSDYDYKEISLASSLVILRCDKEGNISPYVAETETKLALTDLKTYDDWAKECSKIAVLSYASSETSGDSARCIVIYE